jgi:hypothetical protein
VIGLWRYWHVSDDGVLRSPMAAAYRAEEAWPTATLVARCPAGCADPPGVDCVCGVCAAPLAGLLGWLDGLVRPLAAGGWLPTVVGRVTLAGRTLPGATSDDVRMGAVRAAAATVVELRVPAGGDILAAALRSRYGVAVEVMPWPADPRWFDRLRSLGTGPARESARRPARFSPGRSRV